jgi:hypothetical protein
MPGFKEAQGERGVIGLGAGVSPIRKQYEDVAYRVRAS